MISGGRLKWTAVAEEPTSTLDGIGMRGTSWNALGSFRCDMREQSAAEQQYADGVAVVRNVEVRARWDAVHLIGVTEVCRLTVRGRTLRINSIQNLDEADRVAVILCTEVN
jgi:head-tail adaptor